MAPIDPLQLLKALSPLLSNTGGIKSTEEVARLSSLMKKFSRKLVSRCVYVNVLKTTDVETLDRFLVRGGWETIHIWLQDSKKGDNHSFLIDLLKLFKHLPMTIERLKENSSAKIVKALCKSDNEEVKKLANDVVLSWMKLVKGAEPVGGAESGKNSKPQAVIKKKKRKDGTKEKKEPVKDVKAETGKEKDGKKSGKGSKENKTEEFEDVKLPEYIGRELKEPKTDRKKTVKMYQAKFRSTGLEEETPLPKVIPKKATTSKTLPNTSSVRLPSKRMLSSADISLPGKNLMSPEKKFKPSNLTITPGLSPTGSVSQEAEKPGIKLIPAKPRPVHTLQDSTGFMDALVAPPTPVIRKKKKSGKVPTTPPSPTVVAPKLQFYKDTMESQTESESEEKKKDSAREDNESLESGERATGDSAGDAMVDKVADDSATGKVSSPSGRNGGQGSPKNSDSGSATSVKETVVKKKRKSVTFADDANIRQIFYFESDDNERVNVNNLRNFGDLKTLERMKERQAVQNARRIMDDKMEEMMTWVTPRLLDLPPAVVEMGCNSIEKGIQMAREEGTLQELYLTKDLLPDGPYEPEPETFNQEEPKLIPLEDENNPDAVIDFSAMEPLVPISTLPPVISSLLMSIPSKNMIAAGMKDDIGPPHVPMAVGPSGILGRGPPGFDSVGGHGPRFPRCPEDMGPHGGGGMMDGMEYMEGPNVGPPPHIMGGPGMNPRLRMPGPMRMHGPMRGRGGMMFPGPPRGMMRGRGDGRGGNFSIRGRYLCRHFMSGGCNYEANCKFLHPGINGPPLP